MEPGGDGTELTPVRRDAAEAAMLAAIVAFHVVDHRLVHPRWHVVTHAAAGLVATAAAGALGADLDELGLSPAALPRGLRDGAVVAGAVLAPLAVAAAVPRADVLLADARVDDAPRAELARQALLDIPLGTAVYEELVFRSALLAMARRHYSTPVAVALTSATFGLWHVLPALEDRRRDPRLAGRHLAATVGPTVVATALAGVGFAALRLRSGSVAAPILVHAATNVGALVASGATRRRRRRTAALATAATPDPDGRVPVGSAP